MIHRLYPLGKHGSSMLFPLGKPDWNWIVVSIQFVRTESELEVLGPKVENETVVLLIVDDCSSSSTLS